MANWDYKRIGDNGKEYFYYSLGQEFTWAKPDSKHILKIEKCMLNERGVQYYQYSIDGFIVSKWASAARLHYILNQENKAICTSPGDRVLLQNNNCNDTPKSYNLTELSEEEKQLIEEYRGLNSACQKLIKDNIKMLTTSTTASKQKRKNNTG